MVIDKKIHDHNFCVYTLDIPGRSTPKEVKSSHKRFKYCKDLIFQL